MPRVGIGAGVRARMQRIVQALAGREDWVSSGELLNIVAGADKNERGNCAWAISSLVAEKTVLRSGNPPRGCFYRLPADADATSIEEPAGGEAEAPERGPAAAYVAPPVKLGQPALSIGTRVSPEQQTADRGIKFARFCVDFHGIDLATLTEVRALGTRLAELARELHPDRQMDGDVEVELELTAGEARR
jgi:hypothetical protein